MTMLPYKVVSVVAVPMMTWSSSSICKSWPARIKSRVTLMSASLGVASLLG